MTIDLQFVRSQLNLHFLARLNQTILHHLLTQRKAWGRGKVYLIPAVFFSHLPFSFTGQVFIIPLKVVIIVLVIPTLLFCMMVILFCLPFILLSFPLIFIQLFVLFGLLFPLFGLCFPFFVPLFCMTLHFFFPMLHFFFIHHAAIYGYCTRSFP